VIDYSTIPGLDAPLGSVESRAAARLLLELRKERGGCGCVYCAGGLGGKLWISDGPIVHTCEAHHAGPDASPRWKLSKDDIARDRLAIAASLKDTDLTDKMIKIKRPL
jgi:hypothetical protein